MEDTCRTYACSGLDRRCHAVCADRRIVFLKSLRPPAHQPQPPVSWGPKRICAHRILCSIADANHALLSCKIYLSDFMLLLLITTKTLSALLHEAYGVQAPVYMGHVSGCYAIPGASQPCTIRDVLEVVVCAHTQRQALQKLPSAPSAYGWSVVWGHDVYDRCSCREP